jgi:Uma2 family endonuclease
MAAPVLPPPLLEGDRLTSGEFMRRWEAMPELKRAELLDGTVYMPSPTGYGHGDFHQMFSGWIWSYRARTPGCGGCTEATWMMGPDDVPQPDVALRILPERGGQSWIEGSYAVGAPELIVEVALSSYSRDLGVKRRLYERMGVREYLVAVVNRKQLSWFELANERYIALEPGADGILRSRCFPGLWLDARALWEYDDACVLAVLQQGLASPEHAEFVARLAARKE